MSQQTRQRIEIALLALAFGAGGGWAAFQFQLSALSARVARIDDRVTAMYCQQVAASIRGACR